MEHHIDLGEEPFLFINGPLIFLNLTANIFYAFCLVFPPCNRKRLPRPLMFLLGVLVLCSSIYCVSFASMCCMLRARLSNMTVLHLMMAVMLFNLHYSITAYVWLIFYYYIQIVPVQRALLIWAKKNIKVIIYMAFFLNGTVSLLLRVMKLVIVIQETYTNGTWTHPLGEMQTINHLGTSFGTLLHMSISLCIMTVSSVSTFLYLLGHMKSAAQGGSSFSTVRSQMKIAVNGLSHSVLFSVYVIFYLFSSFSFFLHAKVQIGLQLSITITTLYITATTVSMGIAQAAFGQRVADVWKTLKACYGVGMVTNDVALS